MASQWLFMPFVDVITNTSLVNYIVVPVAIVSMTLWLFFHKSPRDPSLRPLSDEEKSRLIEEWVPQPLVNEVYEDHPALDPPEITSKVGQFIDVNGHCCLNMATHNYLDFAGNSFIEERAILAIKKYGVGSCGPRGFYGTVDVHLDLETRLAQFMGMEEAAVYSYNFSTIASAIPAYAKRGDIIYADEYVNFAIQKGLDASRSKIVYFKHNDMPHLRGLLEQQIALDHKNPTRAKVRKQFLIVEGIFMNSGDICPLPELVEIRETYKMRLFIDESISFGTLGRCGRGVVEHFNVPREEVDLVVCSLEHALGTIGGFCCGSSFIVEHQRLSGLGYCFSASLPPLLASAAIAALDLMEKNINMFEELKNTCLQVDSALRKLKGLVVSGDPVSPLKHVYLAKSVGYPAHDEIKVLQAIVDWCTVRGVAFVVAVYLEAEVFKFRPSIRVTVNKNISKESIKRVVSILGDACQIILNP